MLGCSPAAERTWRKAIEVATRGLTDYDPLYAQVAVRVLASIGTPEAKAKLDAAVKTETRVHVRDAIKRALAGGSPGGRRGR